MRRILPRANGMAPPTRFVVSGLRAKRSRRNPSLDKLPQFCLRSWRGRTTGSGMPSPCNELIGAHMLVNIGEDAASIPLWSFDLLADVVKRLALPRHRGGGPNAQG